MVKKEEFNSKEFYSKYIDKITCAYKSDIHVKDGREVCWAKRTSEKERYLFKGLTDDVVLIECPSDMLVIEFELHDNKGEKTVNKEKLKEFVKKTAEGCKRHKLDYCVCSHGGTSDYVYVCNIENLIEGREGECKKEMAQKIIPKEAIDFVDLSNLGKTLIPVIDRPHWKVSKYNGAIHKIIDGKNPNKHKNKVLDVVLQKVIYESRPIVQKHNYEQEEDINSISLTDIISTSGLKKKGNEYQGSNPWHGSDTGTNFTINTSKNVWYCFRCNCGGNVAQAIGLNHGIINSCDSKMSSNEFKEVLQIAKDNYGLKIREKVSETKEVSNYVREWFGKDELAKKIWEMQPYFYDKSKIWWLWDKKEMRWEMVDSTDILVMVGNGSTADTISSKDKTEILTAMEQYGREKIPKEIKPTWIQFKDKIVDIKIGEEFKASPDYFVTNPIPWSLHEDRFVDTPVMDGIFEEWVGKENVKQLYQILAYSLIPSYPIHRIFCFIGGGMNGKSKFLELLRRFVGNYNCCSTELDTLLASRFEVTRLHKKLVCQMGETNFNEMSKTSLLKKLSGGDLIGFEYKNKNPFEECNYAKILIATNNLPTTTDKTIGFYRRWMIIDFPNQFSEKKDILQEIPEEEYSILAVKCLGILKDLLEERQFNNEGSIEQRKEKYEKKSNFLETFLDEFTIEDISEYITKSEFYKRFSEWCKEFRHREMSETSLGMAMKKLGIDSGKKYFNWMYDGKGGQARVWNGIKWRINSN